MKVSVEIIAVIFLLVESAHSRCTPNHDYTQVLKLSLDFFKAQRSGKLPDNDIVWRKNAFTDDQTASGADLSGGYYDAGDHMKYNFKMAFATTVLAWGMIEFQDGYTFAGKYNEGKDTLKWATDYFIKSHTGPNEYYVQCGITNEDHVFWGRADEYYTNTGKPRRQCLKVDNNNPGSDVAAETAAALAATAIVFQGSSEYHVTLISKAESLYTFAVANVGKYYDSIQSQDSQAPQNAEYRDELAWAAAWLFKATGNNYYLQQATIHWSHSTMNKAASKFVWNEKGRGVAVLMSQLAPSTTVYKTNAKDFCKVNRDQRSKTSRGTLVYAGLGFNRVAANTGFLCLMLSHYHNDVDFIALGRQQIDSLLGDPSQTQGERSYLIGYGFNYPKRPQHRGASCEDRPLTCNTADLQKAGVNPQTLNGGLVSGPNTNDGFYVDVRTDSQRNEVSMSQAGFQSAVAALLKLQMDGICQ